jgi:hypothetical protein
MSVLGKIGWLLANNSGVDVMITFFGNFSQFSAKKLAFFSQKPMLWSQFLQKLAVVWAKSANIFAKFFGENILKIITSVPGHTGRRTFMAALVTMTIWLGPICSGKRTNLANITVITEAANLGHISSVTRDESRVARFLLVQHTKGGGNTRNNHKIYQIVLKIGKRTIYYINIFHCKTLQNWSKSGFLVWKYDINRPWMKARLF